MKTKTMKYGHFRLKTYWKTAGEGFEVGFYCNNKKIFVGNFIYKFEATQWWNMMNKEIHSFTKKFAFAPKVSQTFYFKFFTNHMYKKYYLYLDKVFTRYNKTYKAAFQRDQTRFTKMTRKSGYNHNYKTFTLKAA